jgi:hypothetical protein
VRKFKLNFNSSVGTNALADLLYKLSDAWMVDDKGNAIEVKAHMQAGEPIYEHIDEYAIMMLSEYLEMKPDAELKWAVDVLAKYLLFSDIASVYQFGDIIPIHMPYRGDTEHDIWLSVWLKKLVGSRSYQRILKLLGDWSGMRDLDDVLAEYEDNVLPNEEKARKYIHMRLDRTFMRVRAGGLKNHLADRDRTIYFRIPDTKADAWYYAISIFLADHPSYLPYEVQIYSEVKADLSTYLQSYNNGIEFLDLKCSRSLFTSYQTDRIKYWRRRQEMKKLHS